MKESEASVGVSCCQGGALALHSFFAAQPDRIGLGGRTVQVGYGRHCLNKNKMTGTRVGIIERLSHS
jgi:hypothetical protein